MEKKYTSPEMKIVKFESEDIILTSSIITDKPKSFDGAEQLQPQEFSILQ